MRRAWQNPLLYGHWTPGVWDYVLVDREGKRIGGQVVTTGMTEPPALTEKSIRLSSEKERALTAGTGIAKSRFFNTSYQLVALKKENPEQLLAAETLLPLAGLL